MAANSIIILQNFFTEGEGNQSLIFPYLVTITSVTSPELGHDLTSHIVPKLALVHQN